MNKNNNATAEYYLTSPHKKARDFRKNADYKNILKLALQGRLQANDIYQKTNVAEGKKHRGRVIGTMLKNLVKWGFLFKTGKRNVLYRQEIFSLNESLCERIRILVE